jgi:hypothetical protein
MRLIAWHGPLGPITEPQNNALHQTGRGGAAVSLCRRPVVEARPAGERECSTGLRCVA